MSGEMKVWDSPEDRWDTPVWSYLFSNTEVRNDDRHDLPHMTVGQRFASIVDADHDNVWMVMAELYVVKTQVFRSRVEVSGFIDRLASYDEVGLSEVYRNAQGTDCGLPCQCGYANRYVPPSVPGMVGKFLVVSLILS